MTRSEFVNNPEVSRFIDWMCLRFTSEAGWSHSYKVRRSGRDWACSSLVDAFQMYEWNRQSWNGTWATLQEFRRRLRLGIEQRDSDSVALACEAVLRWGGVWANNGRTLEARRSWLLDDLEHIATVFAASETPSVYQMRRDPANQATACPFNAGFVKVYAVLLDYCVIYDSRVGAALGLLVRQYCESAGLSAVPRELLFAFGTPKEARNARWPKRRDPSSGGLRFPRLRQDATGHCGYAMVASWLLRLALERRPGVFSDSEFGFHELAAGLFMVGYDLGATSAGRGLAEVGSAQVG